VSPAKTAEPIEMLFGVWIQVGPIRNQHVFDGGTYPPWEGGAAANCKVYRYAVICGGNATFC